MMENRVDTVIINIIGYICIHIRFMFGLYWDNGNMETTII